MAVERSPNGSSLIDILDRILDKGIVIDAWVRISLVGIDLVTDEARLVVESVDVHLQHAGAARDAQRASWPRDRNAADRHGCADAENTGQRRCLDKLSA